MAIELTLKTIILLMLILALGFLSSYSDIKNRLIRNKLILAFLVIGTVLNITGSEVAAITQYLMNLGFALFVGFFLWYVNFWNEGDGKLFLAFCSLIPINIFLETTNNLYSYNLIVYTFVPIFFIFLVMLALQISKQELIYSLKKSFKPRVILNIFVAFFSFQLIIKLINSNFGLQLNLFIGAVILFFVFDSLEKMLKIKLMYLFYLTAILRLILDTSIYSLDFLTRFVFEIVIFYIFVYFFVNLAYFKFGTHVRIPDLVPGMNLCEKIVKKGDKYTILPDIKISLFMFMQEKADQRSEIDMKPEGLTENQIRKIQNWNKSGKMEVGSLLIQKRIPYAPFQFLGVIILIILKAIGV